MRIWPTKVSGLQAGAALVLGGFSGVAASILFDLGWASVAVGLGVGLVYFGVSMRRFFGRLRLRGRVLPEEWRKVLTSCVPFYSKLDEAGRARFEQDVLIFLQEQRVYGVRGEAVPDETRVLVAASAAMLGHGRPDWEWPSLRDVVIYPGSFSDDYDVSEGAPILGMVHAQGPILFSAPELSHGFCNDKDGLNVGLHEMAHVLDMASGQADGVPVGAEWVAAAPWVQVVADRLRRVRRGQLRKVLRSYGGKNEAELFAVAVELFFERPERLADRDPELFDMLASYFNVDPRDGTLLRPV